MKVSKTSTYGVVINGKYHPIHNIRDSLDSKERPYIDMDGEYVPYIGPDYRSVVAGNGHSLSEKALMKWTKVGASLDTMITPPTTISDWTALQAKTASPATDSK